MYWVTKKLKAAIILLLQEVGKNIYTLKDVVNEIRDKPTKRSLSFLPYTLIFKDPFPEHVRFGRVKFGKTSTHVT